MNLRLAVRSLFKNPFLTIVAILSLGLGIGANAAIFSLFDQILLRNVPVPEPERLVNLSSPGPLQGNTSCGIIGTCDSVFSYPMFKDLQRAQNSFTGIAAHVFHKVNLSYEKQTQSAVALFVSGSYFPVLALQPALGRFIGSSDDQTPGEAHVVVLAHSFWRARFNENPAVLNQTLIVNGQPMTIVGVAPEGFNGTTAGMTPTVFVPITGLWITGSTPFNPFIDRRNYQFYLFARLKPGMSIDEATAAINGPYHNILNDVDAPLQRMSGQTLAKFKAKSLKLEPGKRGQSELHEQARVPLTLLIGVTAFVLLIACANIANLLLARAAMRTGEMAVRLSIGGNRRQLIAQLLSESCLLAGLGGLFSLLVARWTLNLISSLIRPEFAPVEIAGIQYSLDTPALLFAAVLTLGTGILFGLFPALHSSRPNLVSALKGTSGQPGGSRAAARFRWSLATTQIALSTALLILAGLFTKSLLNASRTNLGFRTENLITFAVSPRLNGYSLDQSLGLYERIEDELRALPGVAAVSSSIIGPLTGDKWGMNLRVQGLTFGPDVDTDSMYTNVGTDYFRTLGIALISGRDFTPSDGKGAPQVAIVNEKFVEKFKLGPDPIGKRFGWRGATAMDIEIIGVARNAKYSEVRREIPPQFFRPYRQSFEFSGNNFYVRAAGNPGRTLAAIPALMARIDSNLPVERMRTLSDQVQANITLERVISILSAAFAALATLLAAIGLYGVLAYTVAQRTREIGVRMALGARPSRVRRMVLNQVAGMTLIGGASGFAAALALGRFGESLLFELKATDPMVLATAGILLVIVALVAGFIPAHRASRVDPMTALRYE